MARSCWACGQQNDGGSTHCVNPACGLPLTPAEPDTTVIPTRPCYLRMLALPAGITMVIVLAAAHALMSPLTGPLSADKAGSSPAPLSPSAPPSAPPSAATTGVTPTAGPVTLPLPGHTTTTRPSAPPPPAHEHTGGPVSGAYHMKSLNGGCFDIGYTSDQTPMVAQKPCSSGGPMIRFELAALGSARYRMTAVPQRGINAGQALCVSSAGKDRTLVLDRCQTARADQVLDFVETTEDWYQIQVGGVCVTAMGPDARTSACGNSQAQRFTFTPIH